MLEVNLPDMSGLKLCEELRARQYNGVIVFVAEQSGKRVKVRAFNAGADDFIEKPYDLEEVWLRLEAAARRCGRGNDRPTEPVLTVGEAELSTRELTLRVPGRPEVQLTPTEMKMLEFLMRNSPNAVSREALAERTWGGHFIGDRHRIDVYIRRLREKIEPHSSAWEYLHTIRGVGYAFTAPGQAAVPPATARRVQSEAGLSEP